jgi:hypothetical protein
MCKLGFWVNKQRKDKRCGSLLKDREDRLQTLVSAGLFRWTTYFSAACDADARPGNGHDNDQDEGQIEDEAERETSNGHGSSNGTSMHSRSNEGSND